jgi:hypothetical protein
MTTSPPRVSRLARRDWALIALGSAAWIAIGSGGAWLVRQGTRPQPPCASAAEAPTRQARGAATSPRNAFEAITGQGRCP